MHIPNGENTHTCTHTHITTGWVQVSTGNPMRWYSIKTVFPGGDVIGMAARGTLVEFSSGSYQKLDIYNPSKDSLLIMQNS